jgi:hypothetical protein
MDTVRGFDDRPESEYDDPHAGVADSGLSLGGDERRMHVRAYNHWVSLLQGRPYPTITDLDPGSIADFGAHSVLLDFTDGVENPGIAFLGRALREECGLAVSIKRIADVPGRSLLSRLTDHYLQIIANRAPIGFEAEFVNTRGCTTMYRGILMPFTSGEAIDYIYGVINWKELVDAPTQAGLDAELTAAVRAAPRASDAAPVWADGPSGGLDDGNAAGDGEQEEGAEGGGDDTAEALPLDAALPDRLADARECAAAAIDGDGRSRAALYRALARAHDFGLAAESDPVGYADILEDAGIGMQARAPMTPIVKLVFGADYDKTRLTEFAAVLSHARRTRVAAGRLGEMLDHAEGGIKGIVAAERLARRPAATPRAEPAVLLARRPSLGSVAIDTGIAAGGYVVLLARVGAEGQLDVIAALGDDAPLTDRVMTRAAR